MSRTKEYEIPWALVFIDFERLFDSIYKTLIMEALISQGVNHLSKLSAIYTDN